jgi:hypothetical protein
MAIFMFFSAFGVGLPRMSGRHADALFAAPISRWSVVMGKA